VGATQVNVPAVVNDWELALDAVIELLAQLNALYPVAFVACALNV
jgi:hypothetical protein